MLLVLWGVPTLVVVRSPAWAAAREAALRDRELRSYLYEPLEVERVPSRWSLQGDGGSFAFEVRGPELRASVAVEVSAGRAGRVAIRRIGF